MNFSPKKILRRGYYLLQRKLNPFRAACAVLLYHRIIENGPTIPLAVSVRNFENQMKWLRDHYPVYSLEEMMDKTKSGKLRKHSVTVTFDDGYADNLTYAKPILLRYKIPATVFITSAKLDSVHEFWWDDLERIFLQTEKLPLTLKVQVREQTKDWNTQTPEERKMVYDELSRVLKSCTAPEIEQISEHLFQWSAQPRKGRSTHRTLTTPELHDLANDSLIHIGAHTENHLVLAAQSKEVQRSEIIQSKRRLEMLLGRPVTEFAYPFGLPEEHYSKTSVSIVREAGFKLACSTARSCVRNGHADEFQIPRFSMQDWDENQFVRKLNEFFTL